MTVTICNACTGGVTVVHVPDIRRAKSRARDYIIRELDRRLETRRHAAS